MQSIYSEGKAEPLRAQEILQLLALHGRCAIQDLLIYDSVTSTNTLLLQMAAEGACSGTVVLAEAQTAGRGQRGKSWISPHSAHIYCSVLWRFSNITHDLSGLSLAIGIVVAKLLRDYAVAGVMVKWPNDILVCNKKIGGILVEAGQGVDQHYYAVVGIGLNMAMPETVDTVKTSEIIDQPWTDLKTVMFNAMPSRNQVIANLLHHVLDGLQQFSAQGFIPFYSQWPAYDVLLEQPLEVLNIACDQHWHGIGSGINHNGHLLIRDKENNIHQISSAHMRVKLAR